MSFAVIITADRKVTTVEFPKDEDQQYKLLSGTVGGLIERVHCRRVLPIPIDIWVNEEGLLYQLPQNTLASALASQEYNMEYPLVGDVIITSAVSVAGETNGLTAEEAAVVASIGD